MITYKKMSLFDAPEDSVLVHACNAKGVWGSGIAKEMKINFPKAFKDYQSYCKDIGLVGLSHLPKCDGYWISNLITSSGYADTLDSKDEILVNTTLALNDLCHQIRTCNISKNIYSNKFNSGLFKVPWEETESILKVFVKRYNLNWTVCEL